MVVVFLMIAGVSILFSLWVLYGWKEIPKSKVKDSYVPAHKISVIIPVRNEQENIENLLMDIDNQDLSKEYFEVIVVDDHSEDQTATIVERCSRDVETDLLIRKNGGKGKKEAIETGIKLASGELILTTDGDCRVNPGWLKAMSEFLENNNSVMIAGPLRFKTSRSLHEFLMMEFAALQGIGATTIYNRLPTMCNGANLAYLKSAFIEAGGYEGNRHIPSGDDEFLLHRMSKKYPQRIHFIKSKEAIVETLPIRNLKELFNQRQRWASKWKGYESIHPKWIALVILLFNLNILFGFSIVILSQLSIPVFLATFGAKIIADYMLVREVNSFLESKTNFLFFLIIEFVYPFYVISFGILGLTGNYTWKGRRTNTKSEG